MAFKRLMQPTTDRISGLPLDIIHNYILSSLPDKDVKIMSSLSKTWYHNTLSSPYLVFDDHNFGYRRSNPPSDREAINKYVNYVSKMLRRFQDYNEPNLKIKRLTIPIVNSFHSRVSLAIDSWIELSLLRGIEDFNLIVRDPNEGNAPRYYLPHSLFTGNTSIKVAKFEGFCFMQYFPNDTIFSCPNTNLMKLCLDNVLIDIDEQTLSLIISNCPLIEDLSILSCSGIDCVRISNLHKLKTLRISHGKRSDYAINIKAPSLQSLEIQGPIKIQILECPTLTHLGLNLVKELDLQEILSRFPCLRSISLRYIFRLITKLKISSYILHKLKIFGCHENMELDIDAPNLLSVEYEGDILPLSSLTHYVKGRWNVSIRCKKGVDFLVELSNFCSKVNHITYLNLYISEDTQPFSFDELNKRVDQPLANLSHLELCVFCIQSTIYPDLLDGVLGSYHPRTLSFTLGYNRDYNSNKIDNHTIMKHILKIIMCHRHCCSCTLAKS